MAMDYTTEEAVDICNVCHELWSMAQGHGPISDAVARMEVRLGAWLRKREGGSLDRRAEGVTAEPAQPADSGRVAGAWRECYGAIIKALASMANVRTLDEPPDQDVIPREPIMEQVCRVRWALDAFNKAALAAQPADSGRVDADHARDLRHLIYLDTQFNWRGETDLKLPEMQALEARGWITEGAENGEFEITDAGREAIEAALAAQGQAKVYQCPRCATAMQVDPTAKPAPPASPAGVPDEWKRALYAAHYYIDATDVELEEDRMTRADALRHARNLREALSQESQPNG